MCVLSENALNVRQDTAVKSLYYHYWAKLQKKLCFPMYIARLSKYFSYLHSYNLKKLTRQE